MKTKSKSSLQKEDKQASSSLLIKRN